MILQALNAYYRRMATDKDSDIAPEGFQRQAIPFVVMLDGKGRFRGIQDTRQTDGKKKIARTFIVPKAVKRSVGIEANLLWDNPAYVFGCSKPDKKKDGVKAAERAKEQQESFIAKVKKNLPDSSDIGVNAVLQFLATRDFIGVFSHTLWPEIEEGGANIAFQLEGDTELVCQRDAVVNTIMKGKEDENETEDSNAVEGTS